MPSAYEFILSNPSLSCFDQFVAVVEQFVAYIRTSEGISTVAIHDHEREHLASKFNSLPPETQQRKLRRFIEYYEFCREQAALGVSLKDKRSALTGYLRKFELSLPDEEKVFEVLDEDTYFEIYDLDFIQCYRSVDFFNATSHSMMALESCEWWELFDRFESISQQVLSVVKSVYDQSVTKPIFRPIETHTVKEIGSRSPRSIQTEVVLYCPVFEGDFFQGGIHFFKVQSAYELGFKVVT